MTSLSINTSLDQAANDDTDSNFSTPPPARMCSRLPGGVANPDFPSPPHSDTAMDLSKPALTATAPFPYIKQHPFYAKSLPFPGAGAAFPGLLMPAHLNFAQNVMSAEQYASDVTQPGLSSRAMLKLKSDVMTRGGGGVGESLQESSARVLFSVVHWLRCVGAFSSFHLKCQVRLLASSSLGVCVHLNLPCAVLVLAAIDATLLL